MRRSGRLREALVECAEKSAVREWMDVKPRTAANWEHGFFSVLELAVFF